MSQLLASLCEYLHLRYLREKDEAAAAARLPPGAPQAPSAHRLLPADVAEFAKIMLPLALQGLYSKSGTATMQASTALRHLAFLAPEIVLPPVLDRIYPALTTLTQVHHMYPALTMLPPQLPCPDASDDPMRCLSGAPASVY